MKKIWIVTLAVLLSASVSFAWNLDNPEADRIIGWDNSAPAGTQTTWFSMGTGLEFSGTTIQVKLGTTAGTVSEGNHAHSGVYELAGVAAGLDHAAVTIDSDAAVIFDLSTQEIGLDVQNANTVLAGPATGAANEPTFRALVAADIPDLSAVYQDYDADLATLAGPTAWRMFYSNGSSVITELANGVSGTFLKSNGPSAAPSWDVGAGGGSIGGTLGSVDNVVPRVDGEGGLTLQNSLMTLSDAGSPNIPTGQTYNINGSAHTHNYQPADADLTIWAGVTPSINGRALVALANYAAMLSAIGGQPVDADLTAIAAISRAQGSLIVGGAAAWEGFAIGAVGKVLKSTGTSVAWGDDNNDGGSGGTWDSLGDSEDDATIALAGYKTIFTSTLDTGALWTLTNTDASLSAATSFIDMKFTEDGSANGFFMRGYDNASDLKWSIGQHGAFYGYSFETVQGAAGFKMDMLEATGGSNYIRQQVPDSIDANYTITWPAVSGTVAVIVASGAATFNPGSTASGACAAAVDGGTATGVVTTDTIMWNPSGDVSAVTGYDPSGDLGYIWAYPAADHVYFKFCNKSGSAIDPGSITINWKVIR